MSDTKLLTREEIVEVFVSLVDLIREARPRGCKVLSKDCNCLLCRTDALCTTALALMAEVEGLERDNADLSEYADKKEAEVKRLMAKVDHLQPDVEAARRWNSADFPDNCAELNALVKALEETKGK